MRSGSYILRLDRDKLRKGAKTSKYALSSISRAASSLLLRETKKGKIDLFY